MKKRMNAGRIVAYLFCLSLVGLLVVGVSYARYAQEVQGKATGSVAAVALDGTLDLTSTLQGMRPGQSRSVDFSVTNKKDATVSEVTLNYSVSIKTTGNLPLTYTLAAQNDAGKGGSFAGPPAGGAEPVWTGGVLPYGSSDADVGHTYTLTVTWPEGSADESFADEIDLVTLTVDAQQAKPEAAS